MVSVQYSKETPITDLVKGTAFEDVVNIKSFEIKVASNGSSFGKGVIADKDGRVLPYKIWDKDIISSMDKVFNTSEGLSIVTVGGSLDLFNNTVSVTVKSIKNAPADLNVQEFLETKYTQSDANKYFKEMHTIYGQHVSEAGRKLISTVMASKEFGTQNATRFLSEFAAIYNHDNAAHGLIAHTSKMMSIADLIRAQHPQLFTTQDDIDLLYIGLLFHDLGKTRTYMMGKATDLAFVDHQFLGIEMFSQFKPQIIAAYSENWYYHLTAILLQHHGVWGARPQSVMAYVVHLVDMLDAQMTTLEEAVSDARPGERIKVFAEDESFKLEALKPIERQAQPTQQTQQTQTKPDATQQTQATQDATQSTDAE